MVAGSVVAGSVVTGSVVEVCGDDVVTGSAQIDRVRDAMGQK